MKIQITKGELRKIVREMVRQEKKMLQESQERNPLKKIIREEVMNEMGYEQMDEGMLEEGPLQKVMTGVAFVASMFGFGGNMAAQTADIIQDADSIIVTGYPTDKIKVTEKSGETSHKRTIVNTATQVTFKNPDGTTEEAGDALESAVSKAVQPTINGNRVSAKPNVQVLAQNIGKKKGKEGEIHTALMLNVPKGVVVINGDTNERVN